MTLEEKVSKMFEGYVKSHIWKKMPAGRLSMLERALGEGAVLLTRKERSFDKEAHA